MSPATIPARTAVASGEPDPADVAVVAAQLGREPRGMVGVAWRCPCGRPGAVVTAPRLDDGTPFPTLYYLTCPNAVAACSRLEAAGVMAEMNARLRTDEALARAHAAAHDAYLADRARLGEAPELAGVSAGGMPDRVKCLHALVGHALAAGQGVNPLGDEARALLGQFWAPDCAPRLAAPPRGRRGRADRRGGMRTREEPA